MVLGVPILKHFRVSTKIGKIVLKSHSLRASKSGGNRKNRFS